VRLAEVFRTGTFRTASLAAIGFGATTLLLFGFVYWQTIRLETARNDRSVMNESIVLSRQPPEMIARDVTAQYARDLHRGGFAALYAADLRPLAGEVPRYPPDLPIDGMAHATTVTRQQAANVTETVRAVARRMADGRVLLVGRSELDIDEFRDVVFRALGLGFVPAMLSALFIGVYASRRSLARVRTLNRSMTRIMQGHLTERLDVDGGGDTVNQLTLRVNRMLDEIERLMEEVRGVGDDIAHDLRTPLTRLRARLEGGMARAHTLEGLRGIVEQCIADLDQAFALITALLRIGQIEGSARRAGFAMVSLSDIAVQCVDLYQPVAELQGVDVRAQAIPGVMVKGDRDLLFEAAANLVDNAVKFTPPGGSVVVSATKLDGKPVLSIRDTGPGIAENERAAVLKRFVRGDRSRHVAGHGLGLSLVAAIVRLHGFALRLGDAGPGLVAEILGNDDDARTS